MNLAGAPVLGVVSYGTASGDPGCDTGHPRLDIHMTRSPAAAISEVWWANGPVATGGRDGLTYGQDGQYLFCAGRIPAGARYAAAVRRAYLSAFALANELEYRNIFRMWNFVPGINEDNADGLENYRDFCLGRAEAFEQFPADVQMPAATGIGALGGGIGFYFLAARTADRINVENLRQQPAYRYPRQYGPKSPSFARATCLLPTHDRTAASTQVFVSGTASIVGHETVHPGDIRRQCEETFENIDRLLSAGNLARHGLDRGYELTDLTNIKAYVRHDADMEVVRRLCADTFSADAQIAFFNVDICRADLLVEIEGIVPAA